MRKSTVKFPRFLEEVNDVRIVEAEKSLTFMLGVTDLHGLRFLDVGSGTGLLSLAARRLGATVHSFDIDSQSVACTRELKRRYCADDPDWTVQEGSVLDVDFLTSLGQFDVVYSWGVLHHTGSMWQALANVVPLVADGGRLYISIYNDQGCLNNYWRVIKKNYVRSKISRMAILLFHAPYMVGLRWIVRSFPGRKKTVRGMSLWQHTTDVLGQYPFEVASPESIVEYYWGRDFILAQVTLIGSRHGCNEFVFIRDATAATHNKQVND